jgi:hemolysin-activating ACP:hemolysin acyltransferase
MDQAGRRPDEMATGPAAQEIGLRACGAMQQGEVRMLDAADENPKGSSAEASGTLPNLDPDAIRAAFAERLQYVAEEVKSGKFKPMIGVDAVLSRAVVLMMKSPEHGRIAVADLEWLLLPPIMLGQYKLYNSGLVPVAFAAWGLFSEAVERRYLVGGYRLTTADWRSGDRVTLVHLVAPFGGADAVTGDLKTVDALKSLKCGQ